MQAVAARLVATLLTSIWLLGLTAASLGHAVLGPESRVPSRGPELATQDSRLRTEPVDVAVDPGHSTWDVGATGGGLREYEMTLVVARQVRLRLEALGYRVRLTRESPDPVGPLLPAYSTEAIRIEQEARHAVAGVARAYVSIHFNGHPNRALQGTETYFNSDNFGSESRRLASSVHGELLAALSQVGYTPVDRGVREDLTAGKPYGHFFSLRGPFPSALAEALFLSNAQDAAMLHDEAIQSAIAEGITRGIATYLGAPSGDMNAVEGGEADHQ